MSAIDPRTVDPAKPHPSSNMGHEASDFSWTSVLWLLPISVIALVLFTLVCLYWFRGAKTGHINLKETQFSTEELKLHRLKESEFLNGYKVLDQGTGRVRIPIARAMELVVQDGQGKGKVDWTPITDTYLRGAAFTAAAPAAARAEAEPAAAQPAAAPVPGAKPALPATAKPVPAGKAAEPAQKAQEKQSEGSAPGGGAGTDPKKKAP